MWLFVSLPQSSQKVPTQSPFSPPGQCSVPTGLSQQPSRLRTRIGTQRPVGAIRRGRHHPSTGLRMPIRRSASVAKSRRWRTLLVEKNSSCSHRSPTLPQAEQGDRYQATEGPSSLFRRRPKAIGHLSAGSRRSFPRAQATLQQGLRIECCNYRHQHRTSDQTSHGHSRHATVRLQHGASRATPAYHLLWAL